MSALPPETYVDVVAGPLTVHTRQIPPDNTRRVIHLFVFPARPVAAQDDLVIVVDNAEALQKAELAQRMIGQYEDIVQSWVERYRMTYALLEAARAEIQRLTGTP